MRLGKFMAEADSQRIFPARMHPAVIKRDELHAFSECVNDSRDGIRFRNKNDPFRFGKYLPAFRSPGIQTNGDLSSVSDQNSPTWRAIRSG